MTNIATINCGSSGGALRVEKNGKAVIVPAGHSYQMTVSEETSVSLTFLPQISAKDAEKGVHAESAPEDPVTAEPVEEEF